MATNNNILEDDIQILMNQTLIDRELAKIILKKNNGDLVESIYEIETTNIISEIKENKQIEKKITEEDDNLEEEVNLNKESLVNYRQIVDEKDSIYTKKSEEKEKKKKREKLIQEKLEKGESIDDLIEKKLSNEELYYMRQKGNLTSIQVL